MGTVVGNFRSETDGWLHVRGATTGIYTVWKTSLDQRRMGREIIMRVSWALEIAIIAVYTRIEQISVDLV